MSDAPSTPRPPPEGDRAGAPAENEGGIDTKSGHPGFATTALGPADVRDTPRVPTESPTDPWIGRVLSNVYRVEGKIGEGGMGVVYAVRHVHLGKQYAVKVLSAAIAANANAVERLKQEAVAASSIDHDNIVEVISFDRYADGSFFIVMEYLRGESLADRLARGPIPLHHALSIAYQIAGALGAAHARDIVHRDLKPENVFLAKKGDVERVKVLDFGISKIKSADAEQVKMTRTGQLVGTPLYMSPEQARGETDLDRRVDVYALGVILYEMLTGAPPFDGRNHFELLWKHGNEAPQPLKQRNPNVYIPDEIEAVVLRALAKRREERWQTMEEFAAALVAAAPGVPIESPSMSPAPRTSGEVRPSAATPVPRGERPATPNEGARTDEAPAPPVWRTPPWAIAGVTAVLLAGGVAVAIGTGAAREALIPAGGGAGEAPATAGRPSRDAAQSGSEPSEAAPPEPREYVEAPTAAVGPEAGSDLASVVEVALDSTPPGAEVRFGDVVLGTTPCFADLPVGRGSVRLVFHRDGYLDQTEELVPAPGARLHVRLRPRRRTADPGASSLPMKTEL
jgi:serine/threonine-protein kinase